MSANDEEFNRREVAWRLFASEFRDADYSYAESDEERAPNYVVTPTGARVNRLFVVGVLTEVEYVSDDYLRARIVDPTGAFVVYAGQYQPEALNFLETADTPMFVAVTGKARTFQPDDSDIVYTSIRPEAISEVEATTRDNWVVTTAEQTLERVATMADALDLVERGDDLQAVLEARHVPAGLAAGIPLAIDHYGTTEHYLASVCDLALDAGRVVSGDREEVRQSRIDPADTTDEPVDVGLDDFSLVTGDAQPLSTADSEAAAEADSDTDLETAPGDDAGAGVDAGPDVDDETEAETDTQAESDDESESADEIETDAEAAEGEAAAGGSGTVEEADTDTGAEAAADSDVEAAGDDNADIESAAEADEEADSAAEAVDTDERYELSEEERQEVEENYDVGFSTADEIEGEAGIEHETPKPADEETAEDLSFDSEASESEPGAGVAETDAESGTSEEPESESTEAESESTTVETLEDAVVQTMQDLGDGHGANRDELMERVMEDHGVDEAAVEDAIDDALMSGRCYESGENELTAI